MSAAALRVPVARAFVPLLAPARYKGAYGGRGSAKSHHFAGQAIGRAVADRDLRVVCIREFQKSLELSSKLLLEDKIRALDVGHAFRVMHDSIEIRGGHGLFAFQGMQAHTAESIKSLEGFDIALIEEAQALSERSWRLLRPTIRKPGAEIWCAWNPRKPTDPVDAFFRGDPKPPSAICVEVSHADNPWFPEDLRGEMAFDYARDPEMAAHVWGGGYEERNAARVFNNWVVREFDTPAEGDVAFLYGADWGFSIDPTVLVRTFIVGRTLYVDREAYEVGCPIDRTPFLFAGCGDDRVNKLNAVALSQLTPAQRQKYTGIPGATKYPIAADPARPETINYMQRHGFPNVTGAKKGPGSVEEGVEFLQSYDMVIHPRCRHVVDELTFYSYKVDPKTELVLPVLEDKKNNTIDALRYAVETLRLNMKRAGVW